MNKGSQWDVEWFITCAECCVRFWRDGKTAKERYRLMRKDGWVRGAEGWVCGECVREFAYAKP